MKLRIFYFFFLLLFSASCQERHSHSSEEKSRGEDVRSAHQEIIHFSEEAAELAGIRVGQLERRALLAGAAVPAEVQLEPSSTARIRPLVTGRLVRVAVALGDQVKLGQSLGTVVSTDISQARARWEQARARLTAAEATLKRQEQLVSEGIGAERLRIEAEAQVAELRAEVLGLQKQMSVLGLGQAGEVSLISPMNGVVAEVSATLGEVLSPDQTAFVITDPSQVRVQGSVPELQIPLVREGAEVLVRLHAFPELVMPGTIEYVAPGLEERSRTLPIRVQLQTPDPRLRSGLFGSIELLGEGAGERVLAVPVDALATIEGQDVVFVLGEQKTEFIAQPVLLGRRAGGYFEVRSGLQEGQKLVLTGAFTLKSALRSHELAEGHVH